MLVMPQDLGMRAGDTNLCWPPLYHMGGTEPALHALLTGGRVIIHDGFDAARIAEVVTRESFGWLSIMPGAVGALIAALEKNNVPPKGVGSCGVMPDLVRAARGRAGDRASQAHLTAIRSAQPRPGQRRCRATAIPPGVVPDELAKSPSPASEIRLVDESDNDVANGAVGELAMRGPTLFSGYWSDDSRDR